MPSKSTEYRDRRMEEFRHIINQCLTIRSLDFRQIQSIPMADISDVRITIDNMLFQATKPEQRSV